MSVSQHNWLEDALQLSAVRAAGLLAPNRPPVSVTRDPVLTVPALAPVWRHLMDTMEVSAHHRLPANEMRWIFERVLVYCQRRTDGTMLALIAGRDPDKPFDATAADRLFEDFRSARDV